MFGWNIVLTDKVNFTVGTGYVMAVAKPWDVSVHIYRGVLQTSIVANNASLFNETLTSFNITGANTTMFTRVFFIVEFRRGI